MLNKQQKGKFMLPFLKFFFKLKRVSHPIYDFYIGKENYRGVTIKNILNYNYTELENMHNYIQWLFPTDEQSRFNISAPTLTKEEQTMMIYSSNVQNNLDKAFWKMMNFYGYKRVGKKLERTEDYEDRIKNWITPMNHNYLRITRILKSLMLLGRNDLAKMFFVQLEHEYQSHRKEIGEETFSFWQDAVKEDAFR